MLWCKILSLLASHAQMRVTIIAACVDCFSKQVELYYTKRGESEVSEDSVMDKCACKFIPEFDHSKQ